MLRLKMGQLFWKFKGFFLKLTHFFHQLRMLTLIINWKWFLWKCCHSLCNLRRTFWMSGYHIGSGWCNTSKTRVKQEGKISWLYIIPHLLYRKCFSNNAWTTVRITSIFRSWLSFTLYDQRANWLSLVWLYHSCILHALRIPINRYKHLVCKILAMLHRCCGASYHQKYKTLALSALSNQRYFQTNLLLSVLNCILYLFC